MKQKKYTYLSDKFCGKRRMKTVIHMESSFLSCGHRHSVRATFAATERANQFVMKLLFNFRIWMRFFFIVKEFMFGGQLSLRFIKKMYFSLICNASGGCVNCTRVYL